MNRMLSKRHRATDIQSDNNHVNPPLQNMAISVRDQLQTKVPCHLASYTTSAPAFAGQYLPPIQELKLPVADPAYLPSPWQKERSDHLRHGNDNSGSMYEGQNSRPDHVVHSLQLEPPRHNNEPRWAASADSQSYHHFEDTGNTMCHQERKPKRYRIEVQQDWEKKVWARLERMHGMDHSSQQQQDFPHVGGFSTHVHCELPPLNQARQQACPKAYREQPPAYPSPPYLLEETSRVRSGYPGPSPRRPSSVFSSSTLSGSPDTRRATIVSTGGVSPPDSPTATSTFSDFDTRPGSTAPDELDVSPTFEQIYNVPQVILAPRETKRASILERFPTEVFMRIMMYVEWKKQMLLRQCSTKLYHMVNLEAIPWEIKTATLLHEENFNPRNFPQKVSKTKKVEDAECEDTYGALPSDDDESTRDKDVKGKNSQKKSKGRVQTKKTKSQTKERAHPDTLGRWACHCCFKILPAQHFEGKCHEEHASRSAKDHKERGQNAESDKKADMRVEYVRVIAVNPARVPEWLKKDKMEMKATSDIASYVRQRMERGVNCDDLRWYYKDINTATHCIAPVRGVTPMFTASSIATPPGYETHRPFFKVPGVNASRGVDNDTYTYEIFIPADSVRDENPMVLPHCKKPVGRISQPQKRAYDHFKDTMGPAPEVGDIIALRRFCILCGARNGAYRRDCNRKIISKTNEGWWVCDCRQVRQAGRGNCPDCGRKVIYR